VTAKRALIVDDSKSARVVLSRLLEQHEFAVDTTESAESALLYLRDHRPDVIFMDHVMSGMDGLAAVQAIKSDPGTASIPIMMYTSQDGELYAGEAKAVGAIGVLPKRMAPADVASALYELKLLPDRRSTVRGSFDRVELPALSAVSGPVPGVIVRAAPANSELRAIVEPMLQEQGAELRRFVVASIETMSTRVVGELGAQIRDAIAAAQPAPIIAAEPRVEPPPEVAAPPPRAPLAWIALAALGCVVALAAGAFGWQEHRERAALAARLASTTQQLAVAERALSAARAAATGGGAERFAVPYGEPALGGERLTALATLLAELEARGFAGTVTVTSGAGDFCLTGNPTEGYGLAPGEMPANRCDVVGNPFEESLKPADREPAALAGLLAGVRERSQGAIDVRLAYAPRAPEAYPSAPETSAAQWNAAAAGRNYVEFAPEPRPSAP